MSNDELEAAHSHRSALWAAACAKEITVEDLYAGLAALKRRAQAKYPRR
jgi:hypothetical protein